MAQAPQFEVERPRKKRKDRPPTPFQERWLIRMERESLTLVRTFEDGGTNWTIEPGGQEPPNLRTVKCLLRDKRIEPVDDGLLPEVTQSYRVTSW